ncbi:MAG: hypothetical protein ABIJ18_05745 [archaeon]
MSRGSPDFLDAKTATHRALGTSRKIAFPQFVNSAAYVLDVGEHLTLTITGKGVLHDVIFELDNAASAATGKLLTIDPDSQGALINSSVDMMQLLPIGSYNNFSILDNDAAADEHVYDFFNISFNSDCEIKIYNNSGLTLAWGRVWLFYSCESGGTVVHSSTGAVAGGTSKGGSNGGDGYSMDIVEFE